jgi:hypothetical protein
MSHAPSPSRCAARGVEAVKAHKASSRCTAALATVTTLVLPAIADLTCLETVSYSRCRNEQECCEQKGTGVSASPSENKNKALDLPVPDTGCNKGPRLPGPHAYLLTFDDVLNGETTASE